MSEPITPYVTQPTSRTMPNDEDAQTAYDPDQAPADARRELSPSDEWPDTKAKVQAALNERFHAARDAKDEDSAATPFYRGKMRAYFDAYDLVEGIRRKEEIEHEILQQTTRWRVAELSEAQREEAATVLDAYGELYLAELVREQRTDDLNVNELWRYGRILDCIAEALMPGTD